MSGNALRRLRVNEACTAAEWANDPTEVINVEEARSDIRSTTRAGYSGFNSYPGLQALLDAAGPNKTLLLPPNGVFDLGAGLGNMLKTKDVGQGIVSLGGGAEIKNGGIEIYTRRVKLENFSITGASPYGLTITDPSGSTAIPGSPFQDWATFCRVEDIEIWDKTSYALYCAVPSGLNRFYELRTINCANGAYIDQTGTTADAGDWHFTSCRFSGVGRTGLGMNVTKLGGLALVDTKFQLWDISLLLETSAAASVTPIQGTYIGDCEFEDAGSWDIKINAASGVTNPAMYPRWTQIVGGTIFKIWLAKCDRVGITGVFNDLELRQDTTATNVITLGLYSAYPNVPQTGINRTGAGTSYMDISIDSVGGPYIRTGKRLSISDQDGSAILGSYLTSIASAPAYIGQRALFNGGWYFAKGTTGPSDWVGTGGGIDGGLFTDTYTISGIDGGSF